MKSSTEDASLGIAHASVVADERQLSERIAFIHDQTHSDALVEEYIEGREIYVSILERPNGEPQVFPFFEIDFSDMPPDRPKIVSFEGKWVEDSVEYKGTRPIRCVGLSDQLRDKIAATARAAFETVGLRDYGRIDIRLSADGTPYVIDVNPNCDLSDLAGGFSRAAKAAGLSYKEVILRLTTLALSRHQDESAIPLAARPERDDVAAEEESLSARAGACQGDARSA